MDFELNWIFSYDNDIENESNHVIMKLKVI